MLKTGSRYAPAWDFTAPFALGLTGTVFMAAPGIRVLFGVTPALVVLGLVGLVGSVVLWLTAPTADGERRGLSAVVAGGGLALNGLLVFVFPVGESIGPRGLILIAASIAIGPLSVGWLLLRGYPGRSFIWLVLLVVPVGIAAASSTYNLLLAATIIGPILILGMAAATARAFRRAEERSAERELAVRDTTSGVDSRSINTLAILALVFAFIQGLVAVILGHIALRRIARSNERGRGLAIASLVLGYVTLAGWLVLILVFVLGFAG
jgi:hypothetical protein